MFLSDKQNRAATSQGEHFDTSSGRRQGWKGGWLPFRILELQGSKGSIQLHRILKDVTNFESHESSDGSQAGELLQFKLELCSSASRAEA